MFARWTSVQEPLVKQSAERIRYFSVRRLCDVIHEDVAQLINDAQHNRAGKGKCNVDYTTTEALQQRALGRLSIVNPHVVVAAVSTGWHCTLTHTCGLIIIIIIIIIISC